MKKDFIGSFMKKLIPQEFPQEFDTDRKTGETTRCIWKTVDCVLNDKNVIFISENEFERDRVRGILDGCLRSLGLSFVSLVSSIIFHTNNYIKFIGFDNLGAIRGLDNFVIVVDTGHKPLSYFYKKYPMLMKISEMHIMLHDNRIKTD